MVQLTTPGVDEPVSFSVDGPGIGLANNIAVSNNSAIPGATNGSRDFPNLNNMFHKFMESYHYDGSLFRRVYLSMTPEVNNAVDVHIAELRPHGPPPINVVALPHNEVSVLNCGERQVVAGIHTVRFAPSTVEPVHLNARTCIEERSTMRMVVYTSMHVRALRSAPPCALRMVVYTSMHVRALRSAPPCALRMVVYSSHAVLFLDPRGALTRLRPHDDRPKCGSRHVSAGKISAQVHTRRHNLAE